MHRAIFQLAYEHRVEECFFLISISPQLFFFKHERASCMNTTLTLNTSSSA